MARTSEDSRADLLASHQSKKQNSPTTRQAQRFLCGSGADVLQIGSGFFFVTALFEGLLLCVPCSRK